MSLLNLKRAKHAAVSKALGAPIAIDFGSAALKVLQLSTDGTPTVVAAGAVETPENLRNSIRERLEFQAEALPGLVASLKVKGKRAVCAIPAPLTFCKHAQFGTQAGLPIEVLADNMLTEALGRDASTLIRRLIEVGGADPTTGKHEYICLATGREIIEKLMKAIKASKLEVVGMHSEFEAALAAFNENAGNADAATLYLDIGGGQTQVFIGHADKLTFARSVAIGGLTLDESLARETGEPVNRARDMRLAMESLTQQAGQSGGGVATAGASLSEPLEMLADEIGMCVRYHDAMFPTTRVGNVVFIGGESRHRGLCQHLARGLRLPAKSADPLARIARSGAAATVGVEIDQPQPGWAVPVGLCRCPTDL